MSLITAHVLDAVRGTPAAGITIELSPVEENGSAGAVLASAVTDDDGRVRDLGPEELPAGTYRICFRVGAYFAALDQPTFYPRVDVTFSVAAGQPHYHVPLLLSPFAYSTYRGS